MNIGEKIRSLRTARGLTQSELCGEHITRNMLSAIENGAATPSIDTLTYLAEALDVPPAYLLAEGEDVGYYKKAQIMDKLHAYFKNEAYDACVRLAERLSYIDDEIALILATSYFELGRRALLRGSLLSAKELLRKCEACAKSTVYPTDRISLLLPMYLALSENIQAPMLEFSPDEYRRVANEVTEYEFFQYVCMQSDFEYQNSLFRLHMQAKALMRSRKYGEALKLLLELEERKSVEYNAAVMLGAYADLEICYRELGDFERAYRYATKRISLTEGFQS